MSSENSFIQVDKNPVNLEDIVTSTIEQIQFLNVFDPEAETFVQASVEGLTQSYYKPSDKTSVNLVYKVVYPDELNLKPVPGSNKSKRRVGRPKKKPEGEPETLTESAPPTPKSKIKVVAKTRSGREVKWPKYIQDDFRKIELVKDNSGADSEDGDIKVSDFVNHQETTGPNEPKEKEQKQPKQLNFTQKKRRIPAQYRCPKCKKAYLGRSKILEHLRKNPLHGPMHQSEENHFEVWNYLVSITQKCPSSERGPKFCQELSNLLHNLLLLTNALFKKLGSAANEVKIDKVLGNAIGLSPGTYYFDDNNLYKDVTVLQLMGNTDFLNSIRSKTDEINFKEPDPPEKKCNCGKLSTIDELVLKSMLISSEANESIDKKIDGIKIDQHMGLNQDKCENANSNESANNKQCINSEFFVSSDVSLSNYSSLSDYEMKSDLDSHVESNILPDNNIENTSNKLENFIISQDKKDELHSQSVDYKANENIKCDIPVKHFPGTHYFQNDVAYGPNNYSVNYNHDQGVLSHISLEPIQDKPKPKSPKIKIQSNILICPPNPKCIQTNLVIDNKTYNENNDPQTTPTKNHINPELLTDNSILLPITHVQHTVDELMLPVSSGPSGILDNSSSSDEVMNVDQFVNERFRKLTESDLEVGNSNSLHLDMPALDMFQFHTS